MVQDKKKLIELAEIYGIKRRWFGLEPDFLLRKRLQHAVLVKFHEKFRKFKSQ